MNEMNVLLASAGRRPYLVDWFREGLRLNGLTGRVILADADPLAPARRYADEAIMPPPVHVDGYETWLEEALSEHRITLAVSINDFELSRWARMPARFSALVRMEESGQDLVEDKYLMAQALRGAGVRVPATTLGSEALPRGEGPFIVKSRFGSGSRGLREATGRLLPEALVRGARDVHDRVGRSMAGDTSAREHLVVQRKVLGQEYGLDVLCDLSGTFVTVLARRKLSMRAGETDKARTVDPAPFVSVAKLLAETLAHHGSIDVDVIQDAAGAIWVIDVNPRIGGGYPFSHSAGAHVPAAYIAWAAGAAPKEEWLRSRPDVVSAKFVGISEVEG